MGRPLGMGTVAILAALHGSVRYGLDIIQRTGLLPGTVYTTLRRLETRGLIQGHWEEAEIAEADRRPRRRYYTLTPDGDAALELARERLGDLATGLGVGTPAPGVAE